jgi:exopolyphosphatase/guanosine-5'-triphosphate,3'-diphosphate pyrophosphatase
VIAGIDLGTLTCRLLVAQVEGGGIQQELFSDQRMLRLGEGVQASGQLQPEAIRRVLDTLVEWKQVIERHRPDRVCMVATSAVRDAGNQREFLAQVKETVELDVEVISGEEEARRTMLGIRSGLPPGVDDVFGLDIGGGSTELIVSRKGCPMTLRSINVGVVRLTEQFLTGESVSAQALEAARQHLRVLRERVQVELGDLTELTLVGTAGTVTTLSAMAQGLSRYEPHLIHNSRLTSQTVVRLESQLLGRTKETRRDLPGLEAGREDVIVAGTLILREMMDGLGFRECVVSTLGLREGVVLECASRSMG